MWQTVGTPRLLVIGPYTMGIEIAPAGSGCRLRVFIDYELPGGAIAHWLGVCLAGFYARWCVKQMLSDAVHHIAA